MTKLTKAQMRDLKWLAENGPTQTIPVGHNIRILNKLRDMGLVETTRGPGGWLSLISWRVSDAGFDAIAKAEGRTP